MSHKIFCSKINLLIKEKLKLIEGFNLKGNSLAVLKIIAGLNIDKFT